MEILSYIKFLAPYPEGAKLAIVIGIGFVFIGVFVIFASLIFGNPIFHVHKNHETLINPSKRPPLIVSTIISEAHGEEGSWGVTDIQSKDSQGNSFNLSVFILGEDYNWAYESCKYIEKNGENVNFAEYLDYQSVIDRLEVAKDVIAVGLASQEGKYPELEKERAYARARNLKLLLEQYVKTNTAEFHKLTIGRYIGKKVNSKSIKETAYQRPIIIVAVYEKSPNIDLRKELRMVLKESHKMPVKLNDYEQFELNGFMPVNNLTHCNDN